jgi:hypothetical protein
LILELEDIFGLTVKSVGPELRPCRGVDELRADAKLRADGPQAALDEIADAEFTPDLAAIDGAALINE